MSKRIPKALRDVNRMVDQLGVKGHWAEGTKAHHFFVGKTCVLTIAKGGDRGVVRNQGLVRKTLQSYAP